MKTPPQGSQQHWLLQTWCFSGGLCGLITQLRGFWSCISMAHRALLCPQLRSVQLPAFSPSTPRCLFSTKLSNPIKEGTQSKPLASKGDAPGWGWGDPHCLGLSLLPWAVQWYSWHSCLDPSFHMQPQGLKIQTSPTESSGDPKDYWKIIFWKSWILLWPVDYPLWHHYLNIRRHSFIHSLHLEV